jgi:hypothetical protein
VVFDCVEVQNSCASSRRTVTISVGTGLWHRPDGATHLDDLKPLDPATVTVTVPPTVRQTLLPRDITPIAKVDAQGHCTTLVGGAQSCGR